MRKNKSLHSGILYIRGSDFFVCGKELRETWNVKITMKTSMEGTAEKTKDKGKIYNKKDAWFFFQQVKNKFQVKFG